MRDAILSFLTILTPALASLQSQIAAQPNGSEKHLALLALGSIQMARGSLQAVADGLGSVGIGSTPTAR